MKRVALGIILFRIHFKEPAMTIEKKNHQTYTFKYAKE